MVFWDEETNKDISYVANKIPNKIDCEKFKIKSKGRYLKMIYESEISMFIGYEVENYITEVSIELEKV